MINHIKSNNTAGTHVFSFLPFFDPKLDPDQDPEALRINHALLAASSLPIPGVPLTPLKS